MFQFHYETQSSSDDGKCSLFEVNRRKCVHMHTDMS
jgi:hypothetical protein